MKSENWSRNHTETHGLTTITVRVFRVVPWLYKLDQGLSKRHWAYAASIHNENYSLQRRKVPLLNFSAVKTVFMDEH